MNDGGPAFPAVRDPSCGLPMRVADGMSLRDWFAGQALQGLVSNPDVLAMTAQAAEKMGIEGGMAVAAAACAYADAMLLQREKP